MSAELTPGALLEGRYEILESLGEGAFATVYRILDREDQAQYALKLLKQSHELQNGELFKRFEREALLNQRISHPGCCRVFDFFQLGASLALKMELIDGWTFSKLLAGRVPLPAPIALALLAEAAGAVAALHREGVLHRDVKASNLMLDRAGRVKLMDFGVSWASDLSSLTVSGTPMGTPAYMAPEVVMGQKAQMPTDVYALGILGHQLLTGKLPFRAKGVAQLFSQHLSQTPPSVRAARPELPEPLEQLILACLRKAPESRPSDAGAFERELRRLHLAADPDTLRDWSAHFVPAAAGSNPGTGGSTGSEQTRKTGPPPYETLPTRSPDDPTLRP